MKHRVILTINTFTLSFCVIHLSALFAQTSQPTGTLPAKVEWVKYKIVSGRIQAINLRPGMEKELSVNDSQSGIKQDYSIEYLAGATTVEYRRISETESLTIRFKGPHQLTISQQPLGESKLIPFQLTQNNAGELSFTIEEPSLRNLTADNFWQLMIVANAADRSRIASILESLRPGWRILATTSELENAMTQIVYSDKLLNLVQSEQLIEQLGSANFSARHRAQQRLQLLGPLALALVSQIDPLSLDAEQKRRVQRVVRSISTNSDDTPVRIAATLVNDRKTWMAMLSHDSSSHRQAAADRLTTLLGRQLEFDPQARQEMRRVQIQQLRQQIANN